MISPCLNSAVDVAALRASFSVAAEQYDGLAQLQQTVGMALLPKASSSKTRVLDLGCGTGYFIPYLCDIFPCAKILGVDIAQGMIQVASAQHEQAQYVCADAHCLPMVNKSVDLIYSNLMFQWSDDFLGGLHECRRILADDGELCFSILTKNTMHELHQSWGEMSSVSSLMRFRDAQAIEPLVRAAGFQNVKKQLVKYEVYYPTVKDFLWAMKRLGSKNLSMHRSRGLLTRRTLDRLAKNYEIFRTANGLLPVTYEVLFVYAS